MPRGTVYAPRPGTPLMAAFCRHFLAQNPSPITRADATVWVPSKRIGETFKEALTHAAGGATTLPRICTVSYDEDLDAALSFNTLDDATPANIITPLERTLFLAQRIRALSKTWSLEQATTAAQTLGQLFDNFFDHKLTLSDLQQQLPTEFAAHWQKNLVFLQLVFEEYPQWLAEHGKLDARQHLHRLLRQQTENYQHDHTAPVYALGFADTTALGLELLQAALTLPQAELWLPPTPLDLLREYFPQQEDSLFSSSRASKPEKAVAGTADRAAETRDPAAAAQVTTNFHPKLPPQHPFATTVKLLTDLNINPEEVKIIGNVALHNKWWDRTFTPAPLTHKWQQTTPEGNLSNFSLIETVTPSQEAETISLLMRAVADSAHKTIALITPNRALATQVAATLTQWDIRVNDSAGTPMLHTALGRLLGLLLTLRQDGVSPQTLAALLAHSLLNITPDLAQALDRDVLRGLWLADGWQGYRQKLAAHPHPDKLLAALDRLEDSTRPLFSNSSGTLHDWLQRAIQSLNNLNGSLPTGEEADQLAQFATSLFTASDSLGSLPASEGIDYLLALLRQYPARLSQYQHPRLFIWGTQEARLQNVDHVILASMNTGHWPRGTGSHPWINPQIMAALNLPPPEARLGLNAHDFYSLLQTAEVTLTRSLREADGTETTPSPYLARLELAFGPNNQEFAGLKARGQQWLDLAHTVNLTSPDNPTYPTPPAAPVPGTALQPKRWSMSHIRNLLQCPYKAYANRLLALKELEPYAADPDAADMGNILHETLEAFFQQVAGWPTPFAEPVTPATLPAALNHWHTLSQQTLVNMRLPALQALWAPRLVKIGLAIFSQLAENSTTRKVEAVETTHILPGPPNITARFDRLDATITGNIVVDYKTGGIPSWTDIRQGWEPQLLLEGALLAAAGKNVLDLEFWQLKVKAGGLEVHRYSDKHDDLRDQLKLATQKMHDLKAQFNAPEAAYPAVPAGSSTLKLEAPCKTCPYQGVCRLHEWYSSEAVA